MWRRPVLIILVLEVIEPFGHLDCHRLCYLVALTELFRDFRDFIRQFRYATVVLLTGCVSLFNAFELVDCQHD